MDLQRVPEPMREFAHGFLQTEGFHLMDGTYLQPEELLEELVIRQPAAYPHIPDVRSDVRLLNAFKHRYLSLSSIERGKRLKEKGYALLASFTSFPELIWGCGGTYVSVIPCIAEITLKGNFPLQQEGHRFASFESCPGEPLIALWLKDGTIPADLCIFATSMGGDLPCIHNLLRRWPVPLHFVDIPYTGKGKTWALEYLADQLRVLAKRISKITHREVTAEGLRKGIKMLNELRRSYREYVEVINSAKTPPIASFENMIVTMTIWEAGDPIAVKHATDQLNNELRERVRKGVGGQGVAEDPVRIYMCEKMPAPPVYNFVDDLGGVLLGPEVADCFYLCEDMKEVGDPFEAMADWWLNKWPWSPAISLEERTHWVIEIAKRYNPDGVLFTPVWGCQLDPQYGPYMARAIEEKLNIPTLNMALEDIPVDIGEDGKFKIKGDQRTRIEAFMEMLKARRR